MPRRVASAVASVAAAGAALSAQWLLHVADPPAPFAPFSVASWMIRVAPGGLATSAIDTLGHNALRALAVGTIGAALALAVVLRRLPAAGLAAVAGSLTVAAAALDPIARGAAATLLSAATASGAVLAVRVIADPVVDRPVEGGTPVGRRQVLAGGGLLLLAAVIGTRWLQRADQRTAIASDAQVPADVPNDPTFAAVAGLSPAVTATGDHYTVDINLDDPLVDDTSWRLRVHGAVEHPIELTLADLQAMLTVERLATLSCISNPVGGELVGNSRWTGVPVEALLARARPRPEAITVEARGADGYCETVPMTAVLGDHAMVAIAMNGQLLPRGHGYPARLRIPSRYGVKNVKWLTELVLLDEPGRGYWDARGWDHDAIVRTQSRIDTPSNGDHVTGDLVAAGVAWAGDRGISRVEVSTDDGATWQAAQLEREADPLSWRRWQLPLALEAGDRPIVVRAIDGRGDVQLSDRTPPHPSGATGWHRVVVAVTPA